MDVKFNAEDTIKELTDKNSVVINDKSKEEIEQIVETATKLLQEKEGIEDTVIGLFQSIVEMNSEIFNAATKSSQETMKAAEKEALAAEKGALFSVVMRNYGNTVDFEKLDKNLPEGFTGNNGIYTSEHGNVFSVSSDGDIKDITDNN